MLSHHKNITLSLLSKPEKRGKWTVENCSRFNSTCEKKKFYYVHLSSNFFPLYFFLKKAYKNPWGIYHTCGMQHPAFSLYTYTVIWSEDVVIRDNPFSPKKKWLVKASLVEKEGKRAALIISLVVVSVVNQQHIILQSLFTTHYSSSHHLCNLPEKQ